MRTKTQRTTGKPGKISTGFLLAAAAGLALAVLAAWGLFSYAANRRQHALEVWRGRLEAMADDRRTTLEAWLKERWGDARTLASFPTVQSLASGQSANAEADKEHLGPILDAVAWDHGYEGICVLDEAGGALVGSSGLPPPPFEARERMRRSGPGSSEMVLAYVEARSGRVRIGFLQRVGTSPPPPGGARPGWIFLAVDPSVWLFPLLQREPTPTRTGETVLAYRDGGDIVFLNPLRLRKTEALSFRLPLGTPRLATSDALLGRSGFGEYTDYRGVPVIASVRPIRGTDWGLVVKVDRKEALGPYRRAMARQGLTLLILLALLASVAIGQMRRLRLREIKAVLEERKRSEGRILQLNRLLRTISEINQLIVREPDREGLFRESCRILVEHGGLVMAWVGLKVEDGTVTVAAAAGDTTGYMEGITVRWDDTPEGRGPTGTAIRENRTVVNPDVTLNPAMVPWRARALRAGFLSSAAFPIRVRGEVAGALTVYAEEANAIGDEELNLLEELVGDLGFALGALGDREEREKAEAQSRFLSDALGASLFELYVFDAATWRFDFASRGALQNLGYTLEQLRRMTPLDLKPDFTEETFRRAVAPLLSGELSQIRFEARHRRADGSLYPVGAHLQLFRRGERPCFVAFIQDLTERDRAQEAVRESEARYRGLFEDNVAGVYRSELGVGLVECNQAFARMFGFASSEEAKAQPIASYYADEAELERFRARLLAGGMVTAVESHCRRKDGSLFWALENARVVLDEESGRIFVEGTCIDITDLKEAEATRALLSTAIEQTSDSVVITDAKGTILYVNPAFEKVTGYGRAEALGRNPRMLKSGRHDEAFYREMWETILAGEVWAGRVVNRRKDGSLFTEFTTISPVRSGDRRLEHFVAVKRDVTNEEELERRLAEAKKLETVGMIASGVAHEVRNPLFAITTIVAALEKKLKGVSEYGEYLAHIKDQSGRLNALMNDLLTLGRPLKPEQFAPFLVGQAVHESIDALEDARPGSRLRFLLELPRGERPVWGIKDKLVQVILNLLQNSLHFSPADRPIEVVLRQDGGRTSLTVRDQGPGVPPNLLPRLFEPFQTGRKGGTGLGLAIVRQIVLAHGGTVEAANNDPPPGATFTVRLPLHKVDER